MHPDSVEVRSQPLNAVSRGNQPHVGINVLLQFLQD